METTAHLILRVVFYHPTISCVNQYKDIEHVIPMPGYAAGTEMQLILTPQVREALMTECSAKDEIIDFRQTLADSLNGTVHPLEIRTTLQRIIQRSYDFDQSQYYVVV